MKHSKYLLLITGFAFFFVTKAQYKHPPGDSLEINGVNLWVEREGKGEPLFLIAGGPGSSHVYLHDFGDLKDSISALKDSNLLVFIDFYGRGKSDTAKDRKSYTIQRDVDDLERIRKALGFKSINILGHSFGSVVAQMYAIRFPQNVKRLIIANGFYTGKMYQQAVDNFNHTISENQPELWNDLMLLRKKGLRSSNPEHSDLFDKYLRGLVHFYNPENLRKVCQDTSYDNDFNTTVYYQFSGSDGDFILGNQIAKFNDTRQTRSLKIPVLIIAGRYDRVSTPKLSIKYKEYFPGASYLMLEKSGHFPEVEEPVKLYTELKMFLKR